MRHISMAMAFGGVALLAFLALPAAFHDVANAEAALVTGGDCVSPGPVQAFCDPPPCPNGGQGVTYQSPPSGGVGGAHHSVFFTCPCDNGPHPTLYPGTASTCTSS